MSEKDKVQVTDVTQDHQYDLESTIIDLQTRVSFQEDALQVMSQQMALQADALDRAKRHIHILNQKLNDVLSVMDGRNAPSADSEKPPHY